ncbi:hypothetical protein Gogos_002920, partial [Gossypium gossypioides]|nr:hypothetical protein [Gossypium gossypioides]
LDENQTSCQRDPCEGNRKKFIVPVVVSIIAAVALEGFLKSKNQPFTYNSEIVTITANFETGIGEGGFGKVFRGHLNDGTPVAVKLLSSSSKQGYKEFQAEAQSLMIVHHKNLVSLIGYCKEDDHMALVYEFMSNGNLRQHLFCMDDGISVEIAMWCAQRTSKQRPDISEVIAERKGCIGRNDENVQSEMTCLEMASYSYTLPE